MSDTSVLVEHSASQLRSLSPEEKVAEMRKRSKELGKYMVSGAPGRWPDKKLFSYIDSLNILSTLCRIHVAEPKEHQAFEELIVAFDERFYRNRPIRHPGSAA